MCSTCTTTECTSCIIPYYLTLTKQCSTSCDDYSYADQNRICKLCESSIENKQWCKDCQQVSDPGNYCASCQQLSPLLIKYVSIDKKKCLTDCEDFQVKFIENSIGKCVKCLTPFCTDCQPTNPSFCNICKYPTHKKDGQTLACVPQCSNGQYEKHDLPFNSLPRLICLPCTETSCLTCSEVNPSICLTCLPGMSLNKSSTKCLSQCPDGQFKKELVPAKPYTQCADCFAQDDCLDCLNQNQGQCTKCSSLKVLTHTGKCDLTCGDWYYPDVMKKCQPCPWTYCIKCTADTCYECQQKQYYWVQGNGSQECKKELCPYGYQNYDIGQDTHCRICPLLNCQKCSLDRLQCLECQTRTPNDTPIYPPLVFSLDRSKCKVSCEQSEYQDSSFKCQICLDMAAQPGQTNCLNCLPNTGICQQCKKGLTLFLPSSQSSSCLIKCPQKTVAIILKNTNGDSYSKCFPCPASCLECSNQTTCTKCEAPLKLSYKDSSQCIFCDTTQMKKFIENEICYDCDPNCDSCYGKSDSECLTCKAPRKLSLLSQCLPPAKNPIKVEESLFTAKDSVILVTFNKQYKSSDTKTSFKITLIQPSEKNTSLDQQQSVYNSVLKGYEKKIKIIKVIDLSGAKSFSIAIRILDKIEGGVLHLINSNQDYFAYLES